MVSRSCFRLCFFGFPDTLLLMACAPIYIFGDISSWKTICCWKFNILLEYKVSFCYCLLSWVNVTDKALCGKLAQKNRSAHMGFVVIKFSVHLFIMVFKWLVSRQIRYMPGCELFVCLFFLACIQMYKNLWYFMVHILNDFCLNFK